MQVKKFILLLPLLFLVSCNPKESIDSNNSFTSTSETSIKNIAVSKIKIDNKETMLELGKTLQLEYTIFPSNATDKSVIFESSNTSVANVSQEGLITPIKNGNTTITIKSSNNKKATLNLNVVKPYNKKELENNVSSFLNDFKVYDLKIKSRTGKTTTKHVIPTGEVENPIEIYGETSLTDTRYKTNTTGLLIKNTVETIENNPSENYETQIYHDENNFYQLSFNKTTNEKNKKVIAYKNNEEANLNIGFYNTIETNLNYMVENCDGYKYRPVFEVSEKDEKGTFNLKFAIIQYASISSDTIDREIIHEYEFNTNNNQVTNFKYYFTQYIYAAGKENGLKQGVESYTEITNIEYGDYDTYTGTLFNPNDFTTQGE